MPYVSEPQEVLLEDLAELFTAAEFSTGPVPADSPLAVQFRVEANGGAGVSMEGQGDLSWPEALTLQFTGEAGSGVLALDASLDAVTEVLIDLSDYGYEGSFEIDRRSMHMDGGDFFDPFVLDGGTPDRAEVVDTLDSTQLIYYSYEVWAGVSLDFEASMTPVITVGFEGVQWTQNEAVITTEREAVVLAAARTADLLVDSVFTGAWDGDVSLVFTPTVSVSAPFIGSIELASFDLPISLVRDSFHQDMAPARYVFPLPMLTTALQSGDFGDIDVGAIATVNVPLQNDGHLDLQGTAAIDGTGEFTVFPDQFNAIPGTADGLVVTFAPSAEGPQSANLVLTSNDPSIPDLVIPLSGNGYAEATDAGSDVDETISGSASTCGCASPPAPGGIAAAFLAALAALGWRRRP